MTDIISLDDVEDFAAPEADPGAVRWPVTMPIEVAMKIGSIKEICEAYNVTREEWDKLKVDKRFQKAVREAQEMLEEEGDFRMRAKLQATELLQTSWAMIHDPKIAAQVRADLLKFTVRVAGYEPEKKQATNDNFSPLSINIQLNT